MAKPYTKSFLSMVPYNEEQLWKDFLAGSEESFEKIYNLYFKQLYNYASKFTTEKEVVKDAIHDLFIDLWEKRANLSQNISLKFYLFKAMRNTILDALALNKKYLYKEKESDWDGFDLILSYESKIIEDQLVVDQKENISKALNLLTRRQKEAIFLKFYNDFTHEEISSILSLNVASSYNLISQALQALKKNIVRYTTIFLLIFLLS